MPNTFITTKKIAREGLPILKNNLVVPALFRTDFSKEFANIGDTIQVKKPNIFEGKDFADGDSVTVQEINQKSVDVKMDKIADISVEITAKELALNPFEFKRDVIEPAFVALAEKINGAGLEMYKKTYKSIGTSGTTPDGLDDFANARKELNKAKAPLKDRYAVWDPDADAKFSILDAICNAEKSGSTEALREGSIGRIQGLENFMAQQIKTHTAGTFTAVTTPLTAAATAAGATQISLDGGSGTETLKEGDLLTIGTQKFVVTEDATAVSGAITAKVYPAVQTAIADNTAVVFLDKTAGGHVANLAFNRNAFAFVSRPLPLPVSGQEAYVIVYDGITFRVVYGYDQTKKKNMLSIDTLYGFAPLYPSLATRILG